jgi:E1-E2 ATPase
MTMKISATTRAFLDSRFGSDYDPSRGYTSEEAVEARRRFRSSVEDSSRTSRSSHGAGADMNDDDNDDDDDEERHYNIVPAPLNCPPWICCLLPCLTKIPSMKAFKAISPEDAEVLRRQAPRGGGGGGGRGGGGGGAVDANQNHLTSQWIRYDATSLVCGDVIRLEEGDIVPADCLVVEVLEAPNHHPQRYYEDDVEQPQQQQPGGGGGGGHRRRPSLLVDSRAVTGEDKPRSIPASLCMDDGDSTDANSDAASGQSETHPETKQGSILKNSDDDVVQRSNFQQRQLHWGATVVQGRCIAIVTAIGTQTLVSRLIRSGKFPAKENVLLLALNSATAVLFENAQHHQQQQQHDPDDEDEEDAEAGISLLAARKNNPTTSSVV